MNKMNITESEKKHILSLYIKNNLMNTLENILEQDDIDNSVEQPSNSNNTTNTTGTERYQTSNCASMGLPKTCKDNVLKSQIKINDKCPSDKLKVKLVEDGIAGTKTIAAFNLCKPLIDKMSSNNNQVTQGSDSNKATTTGGNTNTQVASNSQGATSGGNTNAQVASNSQGATSGGNTTQGSDDTETV